MDTPTGLRVYKELADWYERQGQPSMRDRFLVLAADAALTAGLAEEAERLRQRLLQTNPHHLLKPYTSFAQAIRAPDVQTYVRNLRLNYHLGTAENLLRSLRAESLLKSLQEPEEPRAPAEPLSAKQSSAPRAQPAARPAMPTQPPRPAPPVPPAVEAEAAGSGAWLAAILFGLFVTAGAALAVYTLARPFLPPDLLP